MIELDKSAFMQHRGMYYSAIGINIAPGLEARYFEVTTFDFIRYTVSVSRPGRVEGRYVLVGKNVIWAEVNKIIDSYR